MSSALEKPKLENSTVFNETVKINCEEAQDKIQPRYVKVCTLYKPILRRFRSFLREKFDQGRKMSLYQHWTEYMFLKNASIFMDNIQLPHNLKDQENTLKLLTIILPCTIKKIRPLDLVDQRNELVAIFRENCS